MDKKIIISISIIFIIYLLFVFIIHNNFVNHINGYWKATDDFLETSNLSEMLLYINKDCGHIIIDDMNYGISFNYNINLFKSCLFNGIKLDNIEFKVDIKEMNDEWKLQNNKTKYNISLNSVDNLIEIYSGDTLYGILKRI